MSLSHADLEAELAELKAANEAATSWGAAVGARLERIRGIERALRRPTEPDRTDGDGLRPLCSICGLEDGACICAHLRPRVTTDTTTGWQLVPKEPTKEMIQACIWALDRWREKHGNVQGFVPPGDKYQVRWRAMLAAAPAPPKPAPDTPSPQVCADLIEQCARVAEAQAQAFLSPQYASNQPFGSLCERFACEEVAKAIRALAVPSTDGSCP